MAALKGLEFEGLDSIKTVDALIEKMYARRNVADFLLRGGMIIATRILGIPKRLAAELERVKTDDNALALTIDKMMRLRSHLANRCQICYEGHKAMRKVVPHVHSESFQTTAEATTCTHRFCADCLQGYLEANKSKTHIECPDPHCHIVIPEFQILELLDRDGREQRLAERRMTARSAKGGELPKGTKRCPRCSVAILKDGGCETVVCRCGTSFNWETLQIHYSRRLIEHHIPAPTMEHPPLRPDRYPPPAQTRLVSTIDARRIAKFFRDDNIYTPDMVIVLRAAATAHRIQDPNLPQFSPQLHKADRTCAYRKITPRMAEFMSKHDMCVVADPPPATERDGATVVFVDAKLLPVFLDTGVGDDPAVWFVPHTWTVVVFGAEHLDTLGKIINEFGEARIGAASLRFKTAEPTGLKVTLV